MKDLKLYLEGILDIDDQDLDNINNHLKLCFDVKDKILELFNNRGQNDKNFTNYRYKTNMGTYIRIYPETIDFPLKGMSNINKFKKKITDTFDFLTKNGFKLNFIKLNFNNRDINIEYIKNNKVCLDILLKIYDKKYVHEILIGLQEDFKDLF